MIRHHRKKERKTISARLLKIKTSQERMKERKKDRLSVYAYDSKSIAGVPSRQDS